MVPQTYPSILNPYTNRHEMVVKQLASTSGLQRWTDYIPVKLSASTRPAGEQTTDGDGFIAINTSQDTSTGVAFKDWVPVYFDNDATDAWVVSASGYIPIGASGGAIAILKSFGSNAHVYLPGANGVAVSGLPTNNYTLSDGSTGYSAVDGTAGLVLDGAGSVGAELFTGAFTRYNTVESDTTTVPALCTSTGVFSVVGISKSATANMPYRCSVTWSGNTTGRTIQVGGGTGIATLGTAVSGSATFTVVPSNVSMYIYFTASAAGQAVSFDSFSARPISGTHATQATTSNKCAVRQTAGRYRWEFDSTDLLTATYPAGYEAATIIDAKSTGHVTTQNQNIVGSYSMGPSATLYGRIVLKTSPTAAELTVLQRFANMLSGAS